MDNILMIVVAVVLFLFTALLYWKFTNGYVKKLYGKKMFNQWGTKMFYWTSTIMISGLITVFILMFFK